MVTFGHSALTGAV